MGFLSNFLSNNIELEFKKIYGEDRFYLNHISKNLYIKLIKSESDFKKWSKIITTEFKSQHTNILNSLKYDFKKFKNNDLFIVGIFSSDDDLILTLSLNKLTISELRDKVFNTYKLKTEYYDDFELFNMEIKRFNDIFEITRFAHNKSNNTKIDLAKLLPILIGFLRFNIDSLKFNSKTMQTLISITSKAHAIHYKKLFKNAISKNKIKFNLEGENNLELYLQNYPDFTSVDSISEYMFEFENCKIKYEKYNSSYYTPIRYVDTHTCKFKNNFYLVKSDDHITFLRHDEASTNELIEFKLTKNSSDLFNEYNNSKNSDILKNMMFLSGKDALILKITKNSLNKKLFQTLSPFILEFIKIEFGITNVLILSGKDLFVNLKEIFKFELKTPIFNNLDEEIYPILINTKNIKIKYIKLHSDELKQVS